MIKLMFLKKFVINQGPRRTHTQKKQYLHAQQDALLHQCNMASTILLYLC